MRTPILMILTVSHPNIFAAIVQCSLSNLSLWALVSCPSFKVPWGLLNVSIGFRVRRPRLLVVVDASKLVVRNAQKICSVGHAEMRHVECGNGKLVIYRR